MLRWTGTPTRGLRGEHTRDLAAVNRHRRKPARRVPWLVTMVRKIGRKA